MKLTEYLHKLSHDKSIPLDDRVVYLHDTKHDTYFTRVLTVAHVDSDGAVYIFAGEEPFQDVKYIEVVRAYTTTNCINVFLGLEGLIGNYGESEV